MKNNKFSALARSGSPRRFSHLPPRALFLLIPLLASCASSGFYNMTDDWCDTHADASTVRCPGNQRPEQRTAGMPTRLASPTAARSE
jgi:hypothetical protein